MFARRLGAAGLLLLAGCTANRPFRTDYTVTGPGAPNSPGAVIESTRDYKLGFVEFDDQGWFWDPRQWKAATAMIGEGAGLNSPSGGPGAVIVLFVHGWKNNASADNSNVQMFRDTLTQLNKFELAESAQEKRQARRVVGVYAGWRGLSATAEPFKEFSFYERKNTAHKVGHGGLTELLVRLESLQRQINRHPVRGTAGTPSANRDTELIIMGHSFGGGAVYTAISQILLQRFVDSVDEGRVLQSFGDLVILLNPAFEASIHQQLDVLATGARYTTAQKPVMAIFTSESDWATKYAFPVGRSLSTWWEKYRDSGQGTADRETVGNFAPFLTHDLRYVAGLQLPPAPTAVAALPGAAPAAAPVPPPSGGGGAEAAASVAHLHTMRARWHANATPTFVTQKPEPYSFTEARLEPRPNYPAGDPFLIVTVDQTIMNGHDDIENPRLIKFLDEFIVFCRPER